MAKGTESKAKITAKLLEVFPGSFVYNGGKEIRIPMTEDGAEIQIKITLTAAKDNVAAEGTVVSPTTSVSATDFPEPQKKVSMTQEEKNRVDTLAATLGSMGF